MYYFNKYYKKY